MVHLYQQILVDQPASNFLKDREGKTISTKMDSESLKNLAAVTGGKYFKLGPTGEGLAKTFDILQEEGVRRKREQFSTELPIERFQPFYPFCSAFIVFRNSHSIS